MMVSTPSTLPYSFYSNKKGKKKNRKNRGKITVKDNGLCGCAGKRVHPRNIVKDTNLLVALSSGTRKEQREVAH